MKQATITITDNLEDAIESYRRDSGIAPGLDAVVQQVLRRYLVALGYLADGESEDLDEIDAIIFPTGPKPEPLENAPRLLDGSSVAEVVIEDRR